MPRFNFHSGNTRPATSALAAACLMALLAGCGGGSDAPAEPDGTKSATAAANTTENNGSGLGNGAPEERPKPHDPRRFSRRTAAELAGPQAFTPINTWVTCANEGQLCSFTGTKAVRLGKGDKWTAPVIYESGPMKGVPCDWGQYFDGDPAPYVVKECQISDVTPDSTSTRGEKGEWAALHAWPIVPVHASLLPSGRVLVHNATSDDLFPEMSVVARVWDPVTHALSDVDSADATLKSELFCVGFTQLPDGSVFANGTQPNVDQDVNRHSFRFTPFTQTWTREADSHFFRYYPSLVGMGNGDLVALGGLRTSAPVEITRFDGSWKALSGMSLFQDNWYYPWGLAAPNGKLFYAGPDAAMRFIDTTGMGSMTELGSRDGLQRSFGSYALYGAGKMMVAGGAVPAVKSTVLIDLNGSTPVVTPGPSMLRERRHMNLTVMADGSLLAVGGYWGDEPLDVASPNSVLIPERWDPATNQWSDLAPLQRGRGYHSVSILLPDGRVAVGGSGMPFTIPGNQLNMEVFSPPYLFEASTAPSATGNYFWQGAKTGNVSCSDATFGDPNSSVAKSCSYVTATVRAKALPAGTTTCASEGGTCTLPAGTFATVYYGGGTGFLARPGQTGAVACSDANFGNPAATATKGCAYTTANPGLVTQAVLPVGTTICAAENASCTVPAGSIATVYYGANGAHSARGNLTGAVACTNANFGDPIYGTAKSCSLHITSTTTSGSAAQLPPGAIGCAAQNGVCALPGGVAARVYYGAGGDVATGGTGGGQLAARPSIAYAPESVGYGGSFIVKQGPGHTISKAHLIKLGAVTHAQDQGQRLVPLSFTANGSDLQVTAPTNPNIAPPGYYMLFIVNNKGVPSVAKMVQVQQHAVVSVLSRASDKAIEVVPGVNGNGTTVQIKGDAALPDVNKSWDMVPTDGGYFKLVSRATGLALSVPAGSTQDGARVEAIADVNGPHQQWKFTRTTLGYFTIKARHVDKGLRVAGRSTADGAALEQGALGSTLRTSEEWVLMPVGYQRITGVQSGKVAEVVARSGADGAAVAIAPNGADTHQSFRFVPRGSGYFSIEAAHTDKVLGVSGGSTASITPLTQQTFSGAAWQQWTLVPQNSGQFLLQVRHTGQYMNVLYDKVDTGSEIGQYPDNGGLPNQYWRLTPAVSLDPHQRAVSGRAIAQANVATQGWLPWVAASNTIGKPDIAQPLQALKVSAKGVRTALQLTLRAQGADRMWGPWVGDNQVAGVADQGSLLGVQAQLGGTRDSCTVRYRANVKDEGWQAWVNESQTAGSSHPNRPLVGLQMHIECRDAVMAYKPPK